MEINRENMNTLFQGFNRAFEQGIELVKTPYEQFTMAVPSTTASVLFPYLLKFGGMREWIGDRQLKDLESKSIEVFNKDYEDGVKVDRNNIEDDQYGLYTPFLRDLGYSASELWGDLAVAALTANGTWAVDSKPFFTNDDSAPTTRYYGQNVINNMTESALSEATYRAARIAMMGYKAHNDSRIKVNPSLLIVGPSNESLAFDLVKASKKMSTATVSTTGVAIAQDNDLKGSAEMLVLQDLGDQWFLTDNTRPFKAVGLAKRKEAKLTRMDQDTDENVFMRREFYYGTHARGVSFMTMPHMIYGGKLS